MLVLTRRKGRRILIGHDIIITILDAKGDVKVGIQAPKDVLVLREEVAADDPFAHERARAE